MAYHVLYNTLAGSVKSEKDVSELSAIYGDEIITHDITKIADYKDFFAGLTEDDSVIICGGDGTLNRFANDTAKLDIACDVLYYALGSGNDFARDVEHSAKDKPFSIKKYLENLPTVTVKGKTYRFLNNVGFGIDGYCCEVGDEQRKTATKPVNYTAIAIKGLLFHYNPTNAVINVDGKEYSFKKVWLAPTMKGRFYGGGMMACPEQDRLAEDGRLSLMLFHGSGRIKTLMAFPSIFKGEHVKHKKIVTILTGYDISVKFDAPSPVQIDGETILGVTEYTACAKVKAKV